MGHKNNINLRSTRDIQKRKRMNDSAGWEAKMLEQLKSDEPEDKTGIKSKGNKDSAKRLTGDSL